MSLLAALPLQRLRSRGEQGGRGGGGGGGGAGGGGGGWGVQGGRTPPPPRRAKIFWGQSPPPPPPPRFGAKTLLRIYLTIAVTSATSECTFSTLRRLKTYLRSTMKQDRLYNCLLMYCHKSITDTLDTVKIGKRFACAN